MVWILVSGIISLLTGIAFLFPTTVVQGFFKLFNRVVADVDKEVYHVRTFAGIILVLVAVWLVFTGMEYKALWYLYVIGGVIIFFGLLYLVLPGWLGPITHFTDQVLVSLDEYVIRARKWIGALFLLAGLYILYMILRM